MSAAENAGEPLGEQALLGAAFRHENTGEAAARENYGRDNVSHMQPSLFTTLWLCSPWILRRVDKISVSVTKQPDMQMWFCAVQVLPGRIVRFESR